MNEIVAVLAFLAFGSVYASRADFSRYSVFTVGRFNRLRRSSVEREGRECRDCEEEIEIGEERHYFKEIVVLGASVFRYGGGKAYYCHDHASFEIRDDLQPVESFHSAWQSDSAYFEEKVSDSEFKAASDDLTTAGGDIIGLAGIAFIVVIAALFIAVVDRTRSVIQ